MTPFLWGQTIAPSVQAQVNLTGRQLPSRAIVEVPPDEPVRRGVAPDDPVAVDDTLSVIEPEGVVAPHPRDTTLDRDVALKVLPPAFTDDPDRLARFVRETRVLASLNHSGIAGTYSLEEQDGTKALAPPEILAFRVTRFRGQGHRRARRPASTRSRLVHRPRLLSDNGPCYVSKELAAYLETHRNGHRRGKPYHPMTLLNDRQRTAQAQRDAPVITS